MCLAQNNGNHQLPTAGDISTSARFLREVATLIPVPYVNFCSGFTTWIATGKASKALPEGMATIDLDSIKESVARLFQVLTTDTSGIFATILVSNYDRGDLNAMSQNTNSYYIVTANEGGQRGEFIRVQSSADSEPRDDESFRSSTHQAVNWFHKEPSAHILERIPHDQRHLIPSIMAHNASLNRGNVLLHAFYTNAQTMFSRLIELAQ